MKNISWRRLLGSAALVAALAATVSLAGPSQSANAGSADCGSAYFCFWKNAGFSGEIYGYHGSVNWVGYYYNDTADSWFNNGVSMNIRVYEHNYYGGESAFVGRTGKNYDTGSIGWHDRLTSFKWVW